MYPHVYTLPSDFNATMWLFPQAIWIIPVKLAFTLTGVYLLVVLPSPSCPFSLFPQVHTSPFLLTAAEKFVPAAI